MHNNNNYQCKIFWNKALAFGVGSKLNFRAVVFTQSSHNQKLLHFRQIALRACTLVLFITKVTVEHAKVDNEPVIDSDDFIATNKANKHTHTCTSNENDSEDELFKSEEVIIRSTLILSRLPDGYKHKMLIVTHFNDLQSFICGFKIKLDTEDH